MRFFILIFLLTLSNNLLSQDFTETQIKNQKKYTSFLLDEGFRSKVTSLGNIEFKFEGDTYYIITRYNNESYFELERSLSWNDGCSYTLFKAVNESNLYGFNTTVTTVGDECDFIVFKNGSYTKENEDFKSIFYRIISSIKTRIELARDEFRNYGIME